MYSNFFVHSRPKWILCVPKEETFPGKPILIINFCSGFFSQIVVDQIVVMTMNLLNPMINRIT